MTVQDKSTIKAYFQTGDTPTQGNFEDLVDSYADYNATFVAVSGATKTLAVTDVGTIQRCVNATASAQIITIDISANVPIPVGSIIGFTQEGVVTPTVTAVSAAVTVNGVQGGAKSIAGQFNGMFAYKTAADTWFIID